MLKSCTSETLKVESFNRQWNCDFREVLISVKRQSSRRWRTFKMPASWIYEGQSAHARRSHFCGAGVVEHKHLLCEPVTLHELKDSWKGERRFCCPVILIRLWTLSSSVNYVLLTQLPFLSRWGLQLKGMRDCFLHKASMNQCLREQWPAGTAPVQKAGVWQSRICAVLAFMHR